MNVDYRLQARFRESRIRNEAARRAERGRPGGDPVVDMRLIDDLRAAIAARAREQIELLSGRTHSPGSAFLDDR